MIPRNANKPLGRKGTNTHASKQKRAERVLKADKKATWRYRIMAWVEDNVSDLSLNHALPLIKAAIDEGELEGPAPSRDTLARWRRVPVKDEVLSIELFRDKPRSGRPSHPMDPQVEEHLTDQLLTMTQPSVDALIRTCERYAQGHGYRTPTSAQIIRIVESIDPAELTAAAFGARAARADAMLRGSIPSMRTHQHWSLDEFGSITYIKYHHPTLKQLVAVKPKIIILADYHGRAILSYRIARPFKNGAETVGFDSTDVLGTILSAALPDLAHASVREFAGYLPEHLRWDRHSAHRSLNQELRDRLQLDIPDSPGYTPWSRGDIEAIVKVLKNFCAEFDLKGNDHKYLPVGRIHEDPKATRTKASASLMRERAKVPIAISELMSFEEYEEEFGKVVQAYQNHHHVDLAMSPAEAHFSSFRESESRSGRDALLLLDPKVLTITQEGLVHQRNSRREKFEVRNPSHRFLVGDQVECRIDPLLRGAYVKTPEGMVFCKTKKQAALEVDYVQREKDQKAEARAFSDAAEEARLQDLEEKIGSEGVAKTLYELDQKINSKPKSRRKKKAASETNPATEDADDFHGPELVVPPPTPKAKRSAKSDQKVIELPLVPESGDPRAPRGFVRTFHSRIRAV